MKKFYMILAAIAAFTLTAQAQTEGTINVGDWDNASTTYNGSYFDMAPTNFYVAHTGVQMIYTPDLLTDLDGKQNVKITKLQFKFHCETWEEISRNVKVYLQETDATEFAVVEGVKQFFTFGEPVAESELDIDMLEYYGDYCTLEFPVDFAFTPGKSLLVTMVFDALDDGNCTSGSDYAPFYTSGISGKCMTYTDNWSSFVDYAQGENFPDATAMYGCGTNVELPCTQISYTYEEEQPEEGFFLVGTFNDWNQTAAGGRIAFNEYDVAEAELEAGAEFKIITYDYQGNICWFGGQDENNVGYFLINNDMLGQGIMTVQGDTGANFRVEDAGTYEIGLAVLLKGFNGAVYMTVTKKNPDAINTVGIDKTDNAYYNLMGVKYNSMPSVPGIYIHNGKKVLVK